MRELFIREQMEEIYCIFRNYIVQRSKGFVGAVNEWGLGFQTTSKSRKFREIRIFLLLPNFTGTKAHNLTKWQKAPKHLLSNMRTLIRMITIARDTLEVEQRKSIQILDFVKKAERRYQHIKLNEMCFSLPSLLRAFIQKWFRKTFIFVIQDSL